MLVNIDLGVREISSLALSATMWVSNNLGAGKELGIKELLTFLLPAQILMLDID